MKKIISIVVLNMFVTLPVHAYAPICDGGTCNKGEWDDSLETFTGCSSSTCTCIDAQTGRTTTYTCACSADSDCGYNQGCVNGKCQTCKSCSNCTSTTWVAGNLGYQYQISRSCSCAGICNDLIQYRCAAGYFGSSLNGSSGCTRCPQWDGSNGNSTVGSSVITNCYIPNNQTLKNNRGTYVFTATCSYSN